MSTAIYNKSRTYLETTKTKIDNALVAYAEPSEKNILLAQANPPTTTTTTTAENKYSPDISTYVQ